MAEAVLGLGANLGARRATFDAARALLEACAGCSVLARSRLYETPPLGPPQPDFLNAALRVRWDGDAPSLLAETQRIEALLGRERRERWGARTLDIDLLHWSEGPVRAGGLEVPHRELEARAFALAPLLDVAPELAARYAPALARVGGAPPLAQPGWLASSEEGPFACSAWLREPTELASQLGSMIAAHAGAPRATSARSFQVEGELAVLADESWIASTIRAALAGGFGVCQLVVLGSAGGRIVGILTGDAAAGEGSLPPLEVHVDARAGGELRARLRVLGASSAGRTA